MKKILGIGNALVDVLARMKGDELLSELHLRKGGMELVDEQRGRQIMSAVTALSPQRATGGSAGNAILALARLGENPGFVGKVGRDDTALFFQRNFAEAGVSTFLCETDAPTGVAYTLISPDGERTFGTCLGAAAQMTPTDVTPTCFVGYDLLHIEGYLVQNHTLIEHVAREAKTKGLMLSLDLASPNVVSADLDFFRHLVTNYIDIVFANAEESAAFTGCVSPDEAAEELAQCCSFAVVKLGSRGALVRRGKEVAQVPARKVPVVDTTGAGDFFAAGFLYALVRDATLADALRCGAFLSEHVIQQVGTHLSAEAWSEIRKGVGQILNAEK